MDISQSELFKPLSQQIKIVLPENPIFKWAAFQKVARSLHITGGPGSGKSTLMALLILLHLVLGRPGVLIDPNGGTVDAFLGAILNFITQLLGSGQIGQAQVKQLLNRIVYVDMSGTQGYIHPFPLYTSQSATESPSKTASRLLDVIRASSPQLAQAPIMGMHAVEEVGKAVGVLMAIMKSQAPEALDLLRDPTLWRSRLQPYVQHEDYGVRQAALFFTAKQEKYWYSADWQRQKQAFERELRQLLYDNVSLAFFGASEAGINWQRDLEQGRKWILLDFRHEQNQGLRRFKMQWVMTCLMDYFRSRGRGRDNCPIELILEEITSLYNQDVATSSNFFTSSLDELINQIGRDFRVNLTLAHQFPFQIDPKSVKTLAAMSSQILGVTPDDEDSLRLSQQFLRIDPLKIKRKEKVLMAPPLSWPPLTVDERPVEYTVEEQQLLGAYQFQDLDVFQFQCKLSYGEGRSKYAPLQFVSIAQEAKTTWVEEQQIISLRKYLGKQTGNPSQPLTDAVRSRKDGWLPPKGKEPTQDQPDSSASSATFSGNIADTSTRQPIAANDEIEAKESDTLLLDLLKEWQQQPVQKKWDLPFQEITQK